MDTPIQLEIIIPPNADRPHVVKLTELFDYLLQLLVVPD
jgi:hypothetical protein